MKRFVWSAFCALAFLAPVAASQVEFEQDTLSDPTGEFDTLFGLALDIEGERMMVGASGGYGPYANPVVGRVYIYERVAGSWTLTGELIPSTTGVGDRFGWAVSMAGDLVAIGTVENSPAPLAGSVFLFERQADGFWKEIQKLTPSTTAGEPHFGYRLALQRGRLVVGAWGDDAVGENAGAIYVFERQPDGTWIEEAKLFDPQPQIVDTFGADLALDGNRIVAGAGPGSLTGDGRAYLYERDASGSWSAPKPLVPANTDSLDGFGVAVAIEGDLVVVGSRYDDGEGFSVNKGSFCTFEPNADGVWVPTGVDYSPLPQGISMFGESLVLDHGRLAVGARLQELPGDPNAAGAVFLFERRPLGWRNVATLGVEVPIEGNQFGSSLALDGRSLSCFGSNPIDDPVFHNDPRVYDFDAGALFTDLPGR